MSEDIKKDATVEDELLSDEQLGSVAGGVTSEGPTSFSDGRASEGPTRFNDGNAAEGPTKFNDGQ